MIARIYDCDDSFRRFILMIHFDDSFRQFMISTIHDYDDEMPSE